MIQAKPRWARPVGGVSNHATTDANIATLIYIVTFIVGEIYSSAVIVGGAHENLCQINGIPGTHK